LGLLEQAKLTQSKSAIEIFSRVTRALTIGVNRRYRSGALRGDEESEHWAGKVTRRGSVRVERLVRALMGIIR